MVPLVTLNWTGPPAASMTGPARRRKTRDAVILATWNTKNGKGLYLFVTTKLSNSRNSRSRNTGMLRHRQTLKFDQPRKFAIAADISHCRVIRNDKCVKHTSMGRHTLNRSFLTKWVAKSRSEWLMVEQDKLANLKIAKSQTHQRTAWKWTQREVLQIFLKKIYWFKR